MTDDHAAPKTSDNTAVVISVDAMGSDLGPDAVVSGISIAARENPDIRFIITGDQDTLNALLPNHPELAGRCEIRHAAEVVSMEDKPSQVMRYGKNTSMWAAVDAVRNGDAQVCVSCGNTGALMAVSMIRLRKLPSVNRPAIACLWPSGNPSGFNIMLDAGADIRADQEDLLQYALMGVSYARNGLNVARPRVGLLNVGTEEHKGRAELKVAHELITQVAQSADFDYLGFVEGSDIPTDRVDVVVTDGFTGNVALKTGEGTARLISQLMRQTLGGSLLSRMASLLALRSIKRFKRLIDPRRMNGGVFLGLNGTVIKSHGSADATGNAAAIQLAITLSQSDFGHKLAARVASGSAARQYKDVDEQGKK
ncbi:MAG: phosphate acyltransferase [Rhodobacterales bacterium]|nr:MAG: phosphate acyltransferase [Rhodobacterales bacterium]